MRPLTLLLLVAPNACLAGDMFTIIQGSPSNLVMFTSNAPLEQVIGKTSIATGYVTLPDEVGGGQGEIHVDLASLDTGLGLRNKHMRENHLETNLYPEAVFRLLSLRVPAGKLNEGERTAVEVSGTLQLHGYSKQISPVTWMTQQGGELTIESEFNITLSEFNIKRPEFLVLKLADEQQISVKLVGRR